jgi:hypothetical protein
MLQPLGWQHALPSADSRLGDWWIDARKRIAKARIRAFESTVLLISRKIWLEHNNRFLIGTIPSLPP